MEFQLSQKRASVHSVAFVVYVSGHSRQLVAVIFLLNTSRARLKLTADADVVAQSANTGNVRVERKRGEGERRP